MRPTLSAGRMDNQQWNSSYVARDWWVFQDDLAIAIEDVTYGVSLMKNTSPAILIMRVFNKDGHVK